jgi:signal transduction histidine kinase
MLMTGLQAAGGAFQSSPHGDVVFADRAFAELFEFDDSKQLLGTPLSAILPEAELQSELSRPGGHATAFRASITTRRGNTKAVLIFATADRGGLRGVVVPLEEPAAATVDAHGARLELLGRLAGGVAHDFNNILTAINGYVEILLNRVADEDPNRDTLREIRRQADRAARLTRQLLAFGRRQTFQLRVAKINTIVTDMFRMLERVMGDRTTLELELDPALGNVRVDRGQFEQVVMNLVLNARDALVNGGRLILKTANVEVKERIQKAGQAVEPGSYVSFSAVDTGVGMDEAVMARLFEPFFTSKKGKGTGLGLSMVYGIVKQSGGQIFVESTPGQGATFEIWLPRTADPIDESNASGTRLAPLAGGETILVAEDEPGVRSVVVTQLRRKGYKVLEAGNGEDALRVAAAHPTTIHLLLTDVMMPGMTGPELAEAIEKARPEIRIIFMTGYAEEISKLDGRRVLEKPFRFETLAQQLREALDAAK